MKLRSWIKRNQAYLMIGVLLIIARIFHVIIFMYFDDMKQLLASVFSIFE